MWQLVEGEVVGRMLVALAHHFFGDEHCSFSGANVIVLPDDDNTRRLLALAHQTLTGDDARELIANLGVTADMVAERALWTCYPTVKKMGDLGAMIVLGDVCGGVIEGGYMGRYVATTSLEEDQLPDAALRATAAAIFRFMRDMAAHTSSLPDVIENRKRLGIPTPTTEQIAIAQASMDLLADEVERGDGHFLDMIRAMVLGDTRGKLERPDA